MKLFLIFPNQLFEDISYLRKVDKVAIIYEELFFEQFNFHKTKIAYHIASTIFYNDYLIKNKINSEIVDLRAKGNFESFFKDNAEHCEILQYYDTVDFLLEKRIQRFTIKHNIKINKLDNPNFILTNVKLEEFKPNNDRYFQTDFYIKMRKETNLLMELGKPTGGKWTYDSDNRKKIPKGISIPSPTIFNLNKYRIAGIEFVKNNYSTNYGDISLEYYPINFDEANYQLERFIETRLLNYGPYQDAILKNGIYNFHSNISAALNIGLLSPITVINKIIEAQTEYNISLNSTEGFIRQVIGWREFIRMVYIQKGVYQRTNNHFKYHRKLPGTYWTGKTGIEPFDDSINKTLKYSYTHHIERLMILGNFMLLNEIHPDEVYKWFMSLFIDAYDWVMVPNVYGMSQYSDGGLITTKPYISGSNYIIKMSDYKKGEWSETWDALYWRFIYTNMDEFAKNQRMSMMVALAKSMEKEKLNRLLIIAEKILL